MIHRSSTCFSAFILVVTATAEASPLAADGGQPRSSAGSYTHDAGMSPLVSPVAVASAYAHRAGYVGQLMDAVSLQPSANPDPAPEATTVPLALVVTNDDGTATTLSPAELQTVEWTVTGINNPVISVDATPSAVLGNVYEDTPAPLRAAYAGLEEDFSFLVSNIGTDDFGTYADDGLDDGWQVGNFGIDNPKAAPSADPDGDGQTNIFEFLSGYSPADGSEFLQLNIDGKTPATVELSLSKVLPTTRYLIEESATLGQAPAPWSLAETLEPPLLEDDYSFSLPSPGSQNFFRVKLEPR